MDSGYVKLWRKSLKSPTWSNIKLWRFWEWCLLKASHKIHIQLVGFQKVDLKPGQFIFGRKIAAKETGLSERTVRTCKKHFENVGKMTTKTTNKFSIITIINWDIYQGSNVQNDQQKDHVATSKRPASDHKQECKEYKPNWLNKELWSEYTKHRKEIKSPMTARAEKLNINKLQKIIADGYSQELIINNSIENGWKGLFTPKEPPQKKIRKVPTTL